MTFICCCEWSLENKRAPLEISVWDNSRIPHGFSPCQEGDFSFNPQHMVFPAPSAWSLPQPSTNGFLVSSDCGQLFAYNGREISRAEEPTEMLQNNSTTNVHFCLFTCNCNIHWCPWNYGITSEEIKCQFLGRSTRIFLAVFSSIETQPDIYKTEVVANNMQGPITKACHCCFCFSKEIKKKEQGQRMFMRTLFLSATSSSSLSLSGNVTEIQSSST